LSSDTAEPTAKLSARLLSRKAGAMLARNTVVSCTVFAVGFALLWLLVERFHTGKMTALVISMLTAQTLHYLLGRNWIFRGTDRHWAGGYFYFLVNAGIGMLVTYALFWAMIRWTPVNYLVSRVLVSLIAGLTSFLLNAVMNFRQL
jgi:putative flippase GtrA